MTVQLLGEQQVSVHFEKLFGSGRGNVSAVLWAQGSSLDGRLLYTVRIASPPKSAVCSNCVFWPLEKLGNPAGL